MAKVLSGGKSERSSVHKVVTGRKHSPRGTKAPTGALRTKNNAGTRY